MPIEAETPGRMGASTMVCSIKKGQMVAHAALVLSGKVMLPQASFVEFPVFDASLT